MFKSIIAKIIISIIQNQIHYMEQSKIHVGVSGTSVWVDREEINKKIKEDIKLLKELNIHGTTRHLLVDIDNKEFFDLGKGSWFLIFSGAKKQTISECATSEDELSLKISLEVLNDKGYDFEDCQETSKRIFNWAKNKSFYYGNDCGFICDEKLEEINWWECKETGSRYG